jgi:hypothetical protein
MRRKWAAAGPGGKAFSALTGLKAALRLIDDVDAALAAHDTIVAMAAAQGLQRIADFHGLIPVRAILPKTDALPKTGAHSSG